MNEIAELLQQKVGLSPDQAQEAAQAIVALIQSKLPASMQSMVMPLLGMESGQAAGSGGLGGMLGSVEGMFGNKG